MGLLKPTICFIKGTMPDLSTMFDEIDKILEDTTKELESMIVKKNKTYLDATNDKVTIIDMDNFSNKNARHIGVKEGGDVCSYDDRGRSVSSYHSDLISEVVEPDPIYVAYYYDDDANVINAISYKSLEEAQEAADGNMYAECIKIKKVSLADIRGKKFI